MVSCLPVKSGSGLAGLPMEWPESFSFQVCPRASHRPGQKSVNAKIYDRFGGADDFLD